MTRQSYARELKEMGNKILQKWRKKVQMSDNVAIEDQT